jgi:hypothetical protein
MAQGRPQLKRPEDIPQEKPPEEKKPKKVKGPRAVGLLQINSKGKATLIPIAILVDGKFHDASVYKADPVPMALDSGTIYEVEQTGDSQGLFTVSGALHSQSAGSASPWVGAGSFLPNGSEEAKKNRKAEDVPKGMDDGDNDAPPRLTRGNASKAGASSPSPSPSSSSSPSSSPSSSTATPGGSSGTNSSAKPSAPATPPGASSQPANSSSSPASGSGSAAQEKPAPAASDKSANGSTEHGPATAGQAAGGQTAAGQTSADQTSQGQCGQGQSSQGLSSPSQAAENYYRPTLRRGKPTESAPEDDDEPTAKTGKPEPPGTAGSTSPIPVRLLPAISDSGGPDPRAYKFFWKTGEEEEQRNQMLALAAQEVRAYANALAKNRIPANPPSTKASSAKRKSSTKPVQPVFENVQFRAFDLWLNNQPVTILSAEAHLPTEPGATVPAEVYNYSVTVAARTDIYGNLRKLYSGVTDKLHLDITPRLELIDAVDADGDGRGELLFRETTDAGNGYIIYRATADKLWKMFDSLGEEE